jgi:enduracididine biosynthesis enzyme MppR
MLNGYTLPLSPSGEASLVPPPPWHFSGDVLLVEFMLDPDVLAQYLPRSLQPDPDNPRAAAIFGDWQSCTDSRRELLEPGMSQYREFYIALAARWEGEFVARCPFCWVDRDFSLVRGLIQGYPKKLGQIGMTRSFSIGTASAPIGPGGRYAGQLTAAGHRIAAVEVVLEEPDVVPALMTAPLVHTRIFPSWAPEGDHVDELVTGGSTAQSVTQVWSGRGSVEFFASPFDELHLLRPLEVLRGYRFSFGETITGGRLLRPDGR